MRSNSLASTGDSASTHETNNNLHFEGEDYSQLCEDALESTIKQVRHFGWSREAFVSACNINNFPSGLHSIAMPNGAIDLIMYFYESRNNLLAEKLTLWRKDQIDSSHKTEIARPERYGFNAPPPFGSKPETDAFLRRAVEHRLRAIEDVLPFWPQAMSILALPSNIPAAIGLEAQLVDEIWAQAGDRSVDLNWYAKRLGLAYVYKLTELFFIQDSSQDHIDTWGFLDRRISDLRCMKEAKLKGVANMLREGIFAAGHVTSNIIGWNYRR